MQRSWKSFVGSIESDVCSRCFDAAILDGHAVVDAEECDTTGQLECSQCPFK